MKKSEVLKLLDELPDEIDIEKLMYTLYVRRKIEIGLAALDEGDVISDEELEREIATCHD